MNTQNSMDELESRAVDALRALLGRVSVIKLQEIRRGPGGPMLAVVEVLGHSHTLACEIEPDAQPESLRNALDGLHSGAAQCEGAATPLLIAPYFSPEAQALCKEHSASYLDLEGNARLALGEVFIGKRSSGRGANRVSQQALPAPMPAMLRPVRSVRPASHRRAIA